MNLLQIGSCYEMCALNLRNTYTKGHQNFKLDGGRLSGDCDL